MTGKQFREAVGGLVTETIDEKEVDRVGNEEMFKKITDELKVLARSSPEDKYLLVTGLRALGKVVAVTGDGTNDAPALAKADVGFSMGISGTDVAKSASDIVLIDDNFCSVLTAIKYGRNVYDNVRKFLQFQLTVNCVALFIVFAGSVIFADTPLTSVQMLWVNLIMDTFAALALATEPPTTALLDRKPQSRDESIVDKNMWRNIAGQSIYQIAWLLVILIGGKDIFNLPYDADTAFPLSMPQKPYSTQAVYELNKTTNYTILFQAFVFMQIFNQINCRKLGNTLNIFENFFNNWIFIGILITTFVVQMLLVEFGGLAVRCQPLDWIQNLVCLAIGAGGLLWGLLIKLVIKPDQFAGLRIDDTPLTEEERAVNVMTVRKGST
jgi:P-type Ca2+ transporter type 2B